MLSEPNYDVFPRQYSLILIARIYLGGEDPLEEEMTTHSSILAWKIPWTEEPGGLQPIGLQTKSQTKPKQLGMHGTHLVTRRLVLKTTLKVKQYSVEDSREETDLPKCF